MKDIKTLYLTAKCSGKPNDISSYTEAVQDLLEYDPCGFVANVEYIITSSINLPRIHQFTEKYGLAIPLCNGIIDLLEQCVEKCNASNKDASSFQESLDRYKTYRSKYHTCFDMYEYYSEKSDDEYINSYYSFNKGGIQGKNLPGSMHIRFGECAIPDSLMVAKTPKALNTICEMYIHTSTATEYQWIKECLECIGVDESLDAYKLVSNSSLSNLVDSKRKEVESVLRESVMLGNENPTIEYTESDVQNVMDMISMREYQLTCVESTDEILRLQGEIYSLYESLDGIIDLESDSSSIDESIGVMTEGRFNNTDNKYTGAVPGYLGNNHDLSYGEDEPKSPEEEYRRPSAGKPESGDDDEGYSHPSTVSQDNNHVEPPVTDDDQRAINNYYYYTYTNSLNKNSNSFNRDNSSHDNHSSTGNRYTDDHSTGKRINFNDYNRSDDIEESGLGREEQLTEGWFDKFRKSKDKPVETPKRYFVPISAESKATAIDRIHKLVEDVSSYIKPAVEKYSIYGLQLSINDDDIARSFSVYSPSIGRNVDGIEVSNGKTCINAVIQLKGFDQYDFMEKLTKEHPEEVERLKSLYDLDSRNDWTNIHWGEKVCGYDRNLEEICNGLTSAIMSQFSMISGLGEFAGDNDSGPLYDGIIKDEFIVPWVNPSNAIILESSDEESSVYDFTESSSYYIDDNAYDKHIKNIWFIKSSDNAENCCVEVYGYAKPMRGRSSMISLKKDGDTWYALIKKTPTGQWEFPGGGWDKNENPADCASRELNEETQTKVKNIKRLGTQIQYNSNKTAVSPWVKKHVKNSDDWWYGYYSAIFIGEYDGDYKGHINEEDIEDTFHWKPLTFIAKKVSKKLMDAIENFIQQEFKESVSDGDFDGYLSETVDVQNKKFDKGYKAAFNYDNGHLLKITYSLQGCEVTNVGLSKAMIDHVGSVAEDTNKENHRGHKSTKNIRAFLVILKGVVKAHKFVEERKKMLTRFLNDHIGDVGYLDFQAKNLKIIEIYDMYDQKKITGKVPIVGVYAARHMESGKSKILSDSDLAKVHKLLDSGKTKFHIANHQVGDVEIYPTFLSTYWNNKGDHSIMDLSKKVIDSDKMDRSADNSLNNIPDLIGDLEAKGFHVSDAEVEAFLSKYRSKDKWIPDTLSTEVKNTKKSGKDVVTEAAISADDGKPESDHPIRDTMMNIDQKLMKTQQAAKKQTQNFVNAGKVFIKPVKRTYQWVMKICNDWKDKDENKIKEKIADPHERKNIFSGIAWCIKTGSLAKAGLLFNPIFVFLSLTKNIGKKDKMSRIRHEIIGELKTEMEIIDAKMKDAGRAGDNNAKYKLMRLKNELNKKLLRVGGSDVRSWRKIL